MCVLPVGGIGVIVRMTIIIVNVVWRGIIKLSFCWTLDALSLWTPLIQCLEVCHCDFHLIGINNMSVDGMTGGESRGVSGGAVGVSMKWCECERSVTIC